MKKQDKIYNKEKIGLLIDYKQNIKDEKVKNALEYLLHNYNMLYLRYIKLIKTKVNIKVEYENFEKIRKENIELKEKLDRRERLIKILKEEME